MQTHSIPIFSVHHDGVLSEPEVLAAITVGAEVARLTREGTVKALQEKRTANTGAGSKTDLMSANIASKRARKQRSDATVEAIARVLLQDPAYLDLSHRTFADLLNRHGILTG